jgi:hypothetical protein
MVCRTLTHLTIFAGSIAGSALMFLHSSDRLDAAYRVTTAGLDPTEDQLSPSNLPVVEMEEIEATRRELDRQVAVMAERIKTKELLINDLVQGKTTLREVADKFYQMNIEYPACMSVIRSRYPDMSDDERMARNVLEFVRLQDMPKDQLKIVEDRLMQEFYQAFGHRQEIAH